MKNRTYQNAMPAARSTILTFAVWIFGLATLGFGLGARFQLGRGASTLVADGVIAGTVLASIHVGLRALAKARAAR